MKCWFCSIRYTKRHSCVELTCYNIMKRLFLHVTYDNRPRDHEELFTYTMGCISRNEIFSESSDIESVVRKYIPYFYNEYDIS